MIDFETAYSWLNTFNSSCLGVGTRQFITQLSMNARPERSGKLNHLAQQLFALVDNLAYEDEQAECLVAYAWAQYRLQAYSTASQALQRAAQLYRLNRMPHQCAVVDWMRGWLLWNTTSETQYLAGLSLLEAGVQQFKLLYGVHMGVDIQRRLWYQAKIQAMDKTIDEQVRLMDLRGADEPDEPPASVSDVPKPEWQQEYPAEKETIPAASEPAPVPREDADDPGAPPEEQNYFLFSLQTFEVRDWIPAGELKAMDMTNEPLGHLDLDRVLIDGQVYQIKPLKKNGMSINLTSYLNHGQRLVVLKIKGDSMNQAVPNPIRDGDYVLVLLQSHGRDGDIVIAGVSGVDQEATIKRLRKHSGRIDLVPESDNPAHMVRSYREGENVFVSGVALAVFQPVL